MKPETLLTIIIPVYNEEDNLLRVEKEFTDFINTSPTPSKVLFVNDGSTDGSQQLIEAICARTTSFGYISMDRNYGLSAAIKAGFDAVTTPYTGYIDADLQTTPEDFNQMMQYIDSYDLVTGVRSQRKDSLGKKLSSKIANGIRRAFTHDGMDDTGCPLKVIRTDYARRIPMFSGLHRFLPAMVLLQNGRVKQVPVRHFPRMAGQSKFHLFNRLVGPLGDCFAYLWMKRKYINYKIGSSSL